ncbi:MAG: OB-fold nucleic acid binding domain-containing protein, partial [Oscillospiraceae bacterium]|nr:OB-fold nucleic acid binding domain-containing protein [Oscillospiraceae bacterium]
SKHTIGELTTGGGVFLDNQYIDLVVLVEAIKYKITKNNENMAFVTVEDFTGSLELLIFPKQLENLSSNLAVNTIAVINARVSAKDDETISLICNSYMKVEDYLKQHKVGQTIEQNNQAKAKESLYIRVSDEESNIYKQAMSLTSVFYGQTPLYIYIESEKKLVLAPKKLWVSISSELIEQLEVILGNENVAVKTT